MLFIAIIILIKLRLNITIMIKSRLTPVNEARLMLAAGPEPFFPPPGFSFSSNAFK